MGASGGVDGSGEASVGPGADGALARSLLGEAFGDAGAGSGSARRPEQALAMTTHPTSPAKSGKRGHMRLRVEPFGRYGAHQYVTRREEY